MATSNCIAEVAAAVGEPARAAMLTALMDGRALTATELANVAAIAPPTASGHLARLTSVGLIAVEKQGRHLCHRLSSPEAARMIESVMQIAGGITLRQSPRRVGPKDAALREARICYDHLAGALGVSIADAFLLQQRTHVGCFDEFVGVLCNYFNGRGGQAPTKGDLTEAARFRSALGKWNDCLARGKAVPANSVLQATFAVHEAATAVALTGQPDDDWTAIRSVLEAGACTRLADVAKEARNVRLLERGTQLRQSLSHDWRETGGYKNALTVTRQAFVQEHFATAHKAEAGVVVMNMHKAKGKQFDEVIIFEGWPKRYKGEIVGNPDRIVGGNVRAGAMTQARQNFRVSVTRAKTRTTIMSPNDDVCVLLIPEK